MLRDRTPRPDHPTGRLLLSPAGKCRPNWPNLLGRGVLLSDLLQIDRDFLERPRAELLTVPVRHRPVWIARGHIRARLPNGLDQVLLHSLRSPPIERVG